MFTFPNFNNIFFLNIIVSELILLFSKIDPYRHPSELKVGPHLIFEVISVRRLNVVRKIGKKGETWHPGRELLYKLDFYDMTSYDRGLIITYRLEHHFVKLGSGNFSMLIIKHI